MRRGPERRSQASRQARALMAAKRAADDLDRDLGALAPWRYRKRTELREARDELRSQERELLGALGGRG